MERGEIVWARVLFPHKWWPGLVLRTDALGVLVSFFDLEPPRYFLEPEVCPFEDNFRSLRCSTSDALLDQALKLFGRRTLWSLTCPCRRRNRNPRDCFEAVAVAATSFWAVPVLGFILSTAVSPWVEEADFVDAVRVLAQIQGFRGYSSVKQRLMYERHYQRGSENENSVADKTDSLELEDESQLFFEEGEKNLEAGVTNRANSELCVLKESFNEHRLDSKSPTQSKQRKAQSVDEMLANLHCLALDPFYLVGKCLNTLEQNVLRFRSLSFQNTLDICFKKCLQPKSIGAQFSHRLDSTSPTRIKQQTAQSADEMLANLHCLALDPFYLVGKCLNTLEQNVLRFKIFQATSIEAQFSHPGYTRSEISVKVDRKQSCGENFCSSVSCTDTSVNCLGLKRKLHQPSVFYRSFKLHKTMPFFSITGTSASLQINKTGVKANSSDAFMSAPALSDPSFKLCITMPSFQLYGCDAYLKRKLGGFEIDLFNVSFPFSPIKLKIKHHFASSLRSLTYLCNSSFVDLVPDMLNISLLEEASHHGDIVEICKLQEPEKNVDIDTRPCISCVKRQEPGKSVHISEDNGSRDEDVKVDCNLSSLRPFETQSVSNHIIGGHTNFIEVDSGLAAKKCPSQSDLIADIIKTLPGDGDGDGAISTRSNGDDSINVAFGDSFKEHKELYQPVISDSSFESQRGQQLEALSASTSLHMKFPRDFKLPSKQELVKIFSPFGTVDAMRTRISSCTGAAQVVFSHPTDAVAAYQYSKKQVLFGKANIRFWLDPLEHRRRGTKFSVPSPSLTGEPVNLKSCQPFSSDSSFKSQRGEQLEALAPFSTSTSLCMKFPKDFKLPSKEELVTKFSPFGTVDSQRTKVFSYTGVAQVVFSHPTDAVTAYQYAKKKKVLFDEANIQFWLDPLEHRRRGTKFSVPSPSMTGKPVNLKSCQPVSYDSSFKSQRGEQLEALAPVTASASLHMKFPENFKLPSKQELIKKFSPFGTIDSTRTEVFSCTGAAQVVFLDPTDVVAAYHYAKKKRVLFGEANVRFWIDPLEDRRKGTKFSVSPPTLSGKPVNLKSCLKKSSPLEYRDKKKPYNVRFLIHT